MTRTSQTSSKSPKLKQSVIPTDKRIADLHAKLRQTYENITRYQEDAKSILVDMPDTKLFINRNLVAAIESFEGWMIDIGPDYQDHMPTILPLLTKITECLEAQQAVIKFDLRKQQYEGCRSADFAYHEFHFMHASQLLVLLRATSGLSFGVNEHYGLYTTTDYEEKDLCQLSRRLKTIYQFHADNINWDRERSRDFTPTSYQTLVATHSGFLGWQGNQSEHRAYQMARVVAVKMWQAGSIFKWHGGRPRVFDHPFLSENPRKAIQRYVEGKMPAYDNVDSIFYPLVKSMRGFGLDKGTIHKMQFLLRFGFLAGQNPLAGLDDKTAYGWHMDLSKLTYALESVARGEVPGYQSDIISADDPLYLPNQSASHNVIDYDDPNFSWVEYFDGKDIPPHPLENDPNTPMIRDVHENASLVVCEFPLENELAAITRLARDAAASVFYYCGMKRDSEAEFAEQTVIAIANIFRILNRKVPIIPEDEIQKFTRFGKLVEDNIATGGAALFPGYEEFLPNSFWMAREKKAPIRSDNLATLLDQSGVTATRRIS